MHSEAVPIAVWYILEAMRRRVFITLLQDQEDGGRRGARNATMPAPKCAALGKNRRRHPNGSFQP
jgi:hypothetical protein